MGIIDLIMTITSLNVSIMRLSETVIVNILFMLLHKFTFPALKFVLGNSNIWQDLQTRGLTVKAIAIDKPTRDSLVPTWICEAGLYYSAVTNTKCTREAFATLGEVSYIYRSLTLHLSKELILLI
jgi:hypothetical protein